MTISVVTHTSFQVGQVTLATSCRTSWMNCNGLYIAIDAVFTGRLRQNSTAPPEVCPSRSAVPSELTRRPRREPVRKSNGRGGRSRTCDLRFWRPTLYQLSYTPAGAFSGFLRAGLRQ